MMQINSCYSLKLLIGGGLALLKAAVVCAASPDAETGRLLAAQCAQCHGTNGNSAGGIDSLAGASYGEIYNELSEMKTKTEVKLMHYQAKGYTDEQIQAIALYLSSLPGGSGDD